MHSVHCDCGPCLLALPLEDPDERGSEPRARTGDLRMTTDLRLGDCREILPTLEPESVHCCVTSPPYWGLRDYGHPEQIGLEPTLAEHVGELVRVFREVRRVLRDDGTLWLNLGDSYAQGGRGGIGRASTLEGGGANQNESRAAQRTKTSRRRDDAEIPDSRGRCVSGYKPKDLLGMPWEVAFALRADGWYLRADIIWAKPNPMPESVRDRPTKAHEYLFLLSKSERYYYDAAAISEPATWAGPNGAQHSPHAQGFGRRTAEEEKQRQRDKQSGHGRRHAGFNDRYDFDNPALTRNKRSVWSIATTPSPESHFATFPRKLVEPCILAGCPPGGTVLDPFAGTGTVGRVAADLGRRALLIELREEYGEMAKRKTAQLGLVP
jgi:DNA modification methylase